MAEDSKKKMVDVFLVKSNKKLPEYLKKQIAASGGGWSSFYERWAIPYASSMTVATIKQFDEKCIVDVRSVPYNLVERASRLTILEDRYAKLHDQIVEFHANLRVNLERHEQWLKSKNKNYQTRDLSFFEAPINDPERSELEKVADDHFYKGMQVLADMDRQKDSLAREIREIELRS